MHDSHEGANEELDQDAEIDEITNRLINGAEEASSSNSSPEQRFRIATDHTQAAAIPSSSDEDEDEASNTSNEEHIDAGRQDNQMNLNLRALGIGGGNPMAQLNRLTTNQAYAN